MPRFGSQALLVSSADTDEHAEEILWHSQQSQPYTFVGIVGRLGQSFRLRVSKDGFPHGAVLRIGHQGEPYLKYRFDCHADEAYNHRHRIPEVGRLIDPYWTLEAPNWIFGRIQALFASLHARADGGAYQDQGRIIVFNMNAVAGDRLDIMAASSDLVQRINALSLRSATLTPTFNAAVVPAGNEPWQRPRSPTPAPSRPPVPAQAPVSALASASSSTLPRANNVDPTRGTGDPNAFYRPRTKPGLPMHADSASVPVRVKTERVESPVTPPAVIVKTETQGHDEEMPTQASVSASASASTLPRTSNVDPTLGVGDPNAFYRRRTKPELLTRANSASTSATPSLSSAFPVRIKTERVEASVAPPAVVVKTETRQHDDEIPIAAPASTSASASSSTLPRTSNINPTRGAGDPNAFYRPRTKPGLSTHGDSTRASPNLTPSYPGTVRVKTERVESSIASPTVIVKAETQEHDGDTRPQPALQTDVSKAVPIDELDTRGGGRAASLSPDDVDVDELDIENIKPDPDPEVRRSMNLVAMRNPIVVVDSSEDDDDDEDVPLSVLLERSRNSSWRGKRPAMKRRSTSHSDGDDQSPVRGVGGGRGKAQATLPQPGSDTDSDKSAVRFASERLGRRKSERLRAAQAGKVLTLRRAELGNPVETAPLWVRQLWTRPFYSLPVFLVPKAGRRAAHTAALLARAREDEDQGSDDEGDEAKQAEAESRSSGKPLDTINDLVEAMKLIIGTGADNADPARDQHCIRAQPRPLVCRLRTTSTSTSTLYSGEPESDVEASAVSGGSDIEGALGRCRLSDIGGGGKSRNKSARRRPKGRRFDVTVYNNISFSPAFLASRR